jgi:chromosomal replication initiator protein
MSAMHPRTFDTFLVAPNNRFARTAAHAVAEVPGRTYDPLWVWAANPVGKTHLLRAIEDYVRRIHTDMAVQYLGAAELTAHPDLVAPSVLLIDDVDEPGVDPSALRELLAERVAVGRQTVLTSRAYPKTMPVVEQFVQNRCKWGLICDIGRVDGDGGPVREGASTRLGTAPYPGYPQSRIR